FIGGNDGVPFLVPMPGENEQLCTTCRDFSQHSRGIPFYIQALENQDLANPGTVALFQLRLEGLESPSRVTLGAWPDPALTRPRQFSFRQEKTLWDVPVIPMNTLSPADSAVTIYWEERSVAAGESRTVGFTYGLGSVAASTGGGRLAITTSSEVTRGSEFVV